MPNKPFFSIITASYNSEKTIGATIESVLEQNFDDFEYIIIDGKSNDRTMEIVESFAAGFSHRNIPFRFISEADRGIYDAWNKGIAMSTGSWVSFLGSDDEYLPGALLLYHTQIGKCDPACNYISSKVALITDTKKILAEFGQPFRFEKIIRNMDIAQVGSFHKRELFEKVGLFADNYKIVGDLDFYMRSGKVIRPAYFDEVTAYMGNGGVSNQVYKALKEALLVKLKYNYNPALLNYADFYSSMIKCYIKILIKKK